MSMLLMELLLFPAFATVAGLVVWAGNRNNAIDDGSLIRQFLLTLAIVVMLGLGVSRTDVVRLRLDPQFKRQTDLDAHPIYSTIQRVRPDDHRKLHAFLDSEMVSGRKLPDAFARARPLLTEMANAVLGFAEAEARMTWARVTVATLRELQAQDTLLCYRAQLASSSIQHPLALTFSAENTNAFQSAIIEVYDSAGRERREPASAEAGVTFNEAALEYRAIKAQVVRYFGESVSKALNKGPFPDPPVEPPEKMCAARIFQLDLILERPPPMAARLIDGVLR